MPDTTIKKVEADTSPKGEMGQRYLVAEAIRLVIDGRIDGAIRRYVFAENEALRTHVVELALRGRHGRCGQTKQ